jgi:putative ABC transport system permease protein
MTMAPRRPPSRQGPPRLAETLVERALGARDAAVSILGDLAEEHDDLRRSRGRREADRWYWREALRIGARLAAQRAGSSSLRRHGARARSEERSPMNTILRNLRLAARSLRRQPMFAAAIVVTVAVALGANTAVFSLLDALVLRPLPVPDAERLAVVWGTVPGEGLDRRSLSAADFLDLRQRARSFEQLEAYSWWDANLSGDGRPVRLQGALTTPGFLDLLGVRPSLGSSLVDGADRARTVVLSHRLFEDRFAADPSAIGRAMRLDGEVYTVVGVAPPGFSFPWGVDLWAPLVFDPEAAAERENRYLDVIGRLAPRATAESASGELASLTEELERTYPDTNLGKRARAVPLAVGVRDLGAPAFLTSWQVAVVCVLLMACVNVAGLLVARGHERQRELALQLALGAGRLRLIAQLLTESLALVAIGAVIALPLAAWFLDLLRGQMPPEIARFLVGWSEIDLDRRVLAVSAGAALLTALLAGLAPALRSTGRSLEGTLREGRGGGGPKRQRVRGALIGCEVALALTLLVAATLVVRGTLRLTKQDPGYEPRGVLAFELSLPEEAYPEPEERLRFFEAAHERIATIAGVEAVSLVSTLPSGGNTYQADLEIEGDEGPRDSASKTAFSRVATPDYFATLRIPVLSGRGFAASDRADTTRVALVSAKAAERFWPDQDPIGKRLRFTAAGEQEPWLEVVGVVGDITQSWFDGPGVPMVYQALAQVPRLGMGFAVRTAGEPLGLVPQVENAIRAVASDQPIDQVSTLPKMIHDRAVGLRYASAVMGVFGVIAMILAAIGLYGLMAFAVGQRMRELGVRVALGASHAEVLRSAVGRPVVVVAAGTLCGLLLAFAAARWMSAVMFGLVVVEPAVFATLALALLGVAALAALGPARRALHVDPATTLRAE